MRLGFYLSGQQPVEQVLPQVARKALQQGQRLLVVSADAEQLARLDAMLWTFGAEDFLAHGRAGGPHDARQPILLSDACDPANGAGLLGLADGHWRAEAEGFARVLLFFDESGRAAARSTWRLFDGREDVEREFFEFDSGKWVRKG